MSKPVCFVTGVGDGTGRAIVERFAEGGYLVAMIARNEERLKRFESEIEGARAFCADVGDFDQIDDIIDEVRSSMGTPEIVIHNAVAAAGIFQTFRDVRTSDLETNVRVNASALLHLAQKFAPDMERNSKGAILSAGNTGAWRGVPTYSTFAPSKAAQRILAESLARDLGPKGIHVAYITIDAIIDVPFMRDGPFKEKPDDFFIKPKDIAEEFFRIAHQPRSAWSFNVELRPFGEKW